MRFFFFSLKVATAMFGYMTDLDTVDIVRTEEITAEGMCSNRRVLYIIEDTSEDTDIRLTHCIISCAFLLTVIM